MTVDAALFWIIAGLTGASAVMVVVTQNIVRAAVWLLFTLVGTCGVYFLLGAFFVLLAATVSLAAWKFRPPVPEDVATSTNTIQLGAAFLGIPDPTIHQVTGVPAAETTPDGTRTVWPLYDVPKDDSTVKFVQNGKPADPTLRGVERVGYLLPFEIVSVHLTVVLIGAAYLAR